MKKFNICRSLMTLALGISLTSGCAAQGTQFNRAQAGALVSTGVGAAQDANQHPAMKDPSLATETAPDQFQVKFETTKGPFTIEVVREASPNGVDRFYNMVKIGYFKDIAIFRAVEGFMFQFGIHGDPAVNEHWAESNFNDDPSVGVSNSPGTICFAKTGAPNSRSTQMFISLGNNSFLDGQGFTPFGKVVEGMDVLKKINTEYGENKGNEQAELKAKGNAYVLKAFPNIDFIKSVTLVEE